MGSAELSQEDAMTIIDRFKLDGLGDITIVVGKDGSTSGSGERPVRILVAGDKGTEPFALEYKL